LVAKNQFSGELLHFGAVRLRVTGSGVLRPTLKSLDDVHTSTLPTLTMSATTNREPIVLSNFTDQMGCLELKTTGLNETFLLSKVVVYVRPSASGYPQ
jgi:hypothetical protein